MQRSNPEVEKFYKTQTWKKIQQAYKKSRHNICERCGEYGDIVHHKVYVTVENINNPEVTMNVNNLELVCRKCHNKEHFAEDSTYSFDEDGNLIEQNKNILELLEIK